MCKHILYNIRASCKFLSTILKDKVTTGCGMDSIECLAWEGNEPIIEKMYRLDESPKKPKTMQEKIKKEKKFDKKMAIHQQTPFDEVYIEFDIYRGLDPYPASKKKQFVEGAKSIDTIQHIQKSINLSGGCNIPAQRWIEDWIESQKCYKYSKYLVKIPAFKRYSEWELDFKSWVIPSKNMRITGLSLGSLSSLGKITLDDNIIFHKKTVQTYFGPIELGASYVVCLKIIGEKAPCLETKIEKQYDDHLNLGPWLEIKGPYAGPIFPVFNDDLDIEERFAYEFIY